MAMIIGQDTELGRELAKWEQPDYVFQRFPAMLYKAQKKANGQVGCIETPQAPPPGCSPQEYDQIQGELTRFNMANQRIAKNEDEERRLHNDGWKDTPTEAIEAFEAQELALGRAAAENNYRAARMSQKAQAELKTADDATHEHLGDGVPVPKKRPGRPRKAKAEEPGA